jgi:hypothetical protein
MDALEEVLKKNEGYVDRGLRIGLGLGLLLLVFIGPRTPWGLLGAFPLLTGALGICPLYRFFGISTCSPRARA